MNSFLGIGKSKNIINRKVHAKCCDVFLSVHLCHVINGLHVCFTCDSINERVCLT